MRPNETKRDYHRRRIEDLKSRRTPWESDWSDLASYFAPARLRLSLSDNERGAPSRKKILDSSGTFALRTLASGMHSGITSPARPWFRLTTPDTDLRERSAVKEYLSAVEMKMREVLAASNVYRSFHWGYGDLGLMGQSCGLLVENERRLVHMIQLLHGSFWLARDGEGRATTVYRQFSWSVDQIVGRFIQKPDGSMDWSAASVTLKSAWDRSKYDERFTICHAVEPRTNRKLDKLDKKNKPWMSVYWEDGAHTVTGDGLLEESGFDSNPIIAPVWEQVAEDSYGVSPGMDALPDTKALQTMQRQFGEAVEKKIRPPMTGPTSLKSNPASLMPGSVTYVDQVQGGAAYRPAIEVNIQLGELDAKIQRTAQQIDRALYADLFLMLANMEGIQPRNQFEIAERKEEKLLALGPVLENIYSGQLAPTIDRLYEVLETRQMLPPPPEELRGVDLQIEYTSILAQAQKAVATGAIERVASFIGNLAAVKPEVLDKFDADEAVDQYAEMIGSPPSIIVPDEEVQKARKFRAERQAQAEQTAAMTQAAPAIKDGAEAARVLSEVDAGGGQGLLQQLGLN